MPTTQKAVLKHRENLKKRGLGRVEVQASPADADLLRSTARVLRGNSAEAAWVRRLLREALDPEVERVSLKKLLEEAPLGGVDLSRRKDGAGPAGDSLSHRQHPRRLSDDSPRLTRPSDRVSLWIIN